MDATRIMELRGGVYTVRIRVSERAKVWFEVLCILAGGALLSWLAVGGIESFSRWLWLAGR